MKRMARLFAVAVLAVCTFIAGAWVQWRAARAGANGDRRILYYHDPMHPAYRSDKPGIAPDCGMQLEPVYADGSKDDQAGMHLPPGTVLVTPEKQQIVGIRVATVERSTGNRTVRALGRVVPDESRVYIVNAAVDGWIQDVTSSSTGTIVEANQVLATFFAPQFISAQQAVISSLSAGVPSSTNAALYQTNIYTNLRSLGMSDAQIATLEKDKKLADRIWITSPIKGVIVSRNIYPGLRFARGAEFYKIADLRHVWILADVFENDSHQFRPGMKLPISLRYGHKKAMARVSDALPQFDPASRTLKVRLELDNPDYAFRPDMFVDVELPIAVPEGVTIPLEAIIDTGTRKTVFVDRGNGYFEPRRVETGARAGDYVQVTNGLTAGERIVVSGTFLIDSESRMQAAAMGINGEAVTDPVCGMYTDQARARSANKTATYNGQQFYFCSDHCKREFEKDATRYAGGHVQQAALEQKPAHKEAVTPKRTEAPRQHETDMHANDNDTNEVPDLVCGMTVDKKEAKADGLTVTHNGTTYYFCSKTCKRKFEAEPEKYLEKKPAAGNAHDALPIGY